MALLDVEHLSVTYTPRDGAAVPAVHDVSFSIAEGEFVGLIGESGCGKSTLGNAVLRLLVPPAGIAGGRILFDGVDLADIDDEALRRLRWTRLSTVFQSSMNSLNPVIRIRTLFEDTFAAHDVRVDVTERATELLAMVSLEPGVLQSYPHELSGGMRQRVALALALALRPKLVILDEPTTGLDVVVQRDILARLAALRAEFGFAVLFVSHDLGTVLDAADRAMVMYAGEIVEDRPAGELLRDPRHPYSRALLSSYADPRTPDPKVSFLPGRPPDLSVELVGCRFAARCPYVEDACRTEHPDLVTPRAVVSPDTTMALGIVKDSDVAVAEQRVRCLVEQEGRLPALAEGTFPVLSTVREPADDRQPVLEVAQVSKTYISRRGFSRTRTDAVKDVSLELRRGRVTALVGQSGSGKSTIARLVTGVERPTEGSVLFHGGAGGGVDGGSAAVTRVDRLRGRAMRDYRRHVQMVFQDPFSALNPTRTIGYALARPLINYRGLSGSAVRDASVELLESVGLSPAAQFLDKLPHQLSGGQRQRVVTARALAPEPEILIADEPVSMLDVSIRAEILQLLGTLVTERRLAMLYITHDLLSARLLADEVLVLNHGLLVERGPTAEVIASPKDDYTRLLLDSIPNPFAAAGNPVPAAGAAALTAPSD